MERKINEHLKSRVCTCDNCCSTVLLEECRIASKENEGIANVLCKECYKRYY